MKTRLSFILALPVAFVLIGTANAQIISADQTSLTFSAQFGGGPVSQTLNITAASGSPFVALFPSTSWLKVSPPNGNTPLKVTVSADPTGLPVGPITANLAIDSGTNNLNIPVTFNVSSIGVNVQSISLAYTVGGSVQSVAPLVLSSAQALNYQVSFTSSSGGNWLALPAPSGAIAAGGTASVPVTLNSAILPNLPATTYNGTITVTPSVGSAIGIPVTLVVSPEPPITVSTAAVNLNYQIGGVNSVGAVQSVSFSTTAAQPLSFAFGTPVITGSNPSGQNWITVTPTSGTVPAASGSTPGSVTAQIGYNAAANLPPGTYTGTVPITAAGAALSQSSMNVTLLVSNNPLLADSSTSLNFTYELGAATPPTQTFTPVSSAVAASSATGQMPVTAAVTSNSSWLSVNPSSLNTGSPVTVTVNPSNLLPGSYAGTIVVTPGGGAGNGAQTVTVSLVVANDASVQASTTGLQFPYQIGQFTPAPQNVTVTSSTGSLLNYTLAGTETSCTGVSWLPTLPSGTLQTPSAFSVQLQNLASLPAGTCAGTITITATNANTGAAALNSPLTIPVTVVVSATPLLVAAPTALSFTSPAGGAISAPQNITVTSTGATGLTYTAGTTTSNCGNNWLLLAGQNGSTATGQNTISVSVNPNPNGTLPAGTCTGAITITSTTAGVANSPVTIPVTFQITSGTLSLAASSLTFAQTAGGAAPVSQTVAVSGAGQTLNYSAVANSGTAGVNWLSVTPAAGTTPSNLTVAVDGSKLSSGQYTGTVTVTSPNATGSPAVITVTFNVNGGTISATPAPASGLTFSQIFQNATAPASQNITLSAAPGAIGYTAAATTATGGQWLTVTPATGTTVTGSNVVSVGVNAAVASTLAMGTYQGTVTISAPGATGSPLTYAVTLNVVQGLTINTSPSAVAFSYITSSTVPATQAVQVTLSGPPGIGTIALTPYTTAVKTNSGNWLSYTANSQTLPATFTIGAAVAGLAAGNYTGTITISTANSAAPAVINVTLSVSTAPTPVVTAIANAASYANGAVSPGENIVIGGINFGPATTAVAAPDASGNFPTTLGNTSVAFDGTPAPMIYSASGQVSVMVPYGVAGRPATAVTVTYLGVTSAPLTYTVAASVPGIYTLNQQGNGTGAIVNEAGTVNGPGNSAPKGSVVSVYMTGEGVTSPASTTGATAPVNGSGLNKPVLAPVTATVGGLPATVNYAGSAPGIIYGVMQVNVVIPANAPTGALPIVINLGAGTPVSTQAGVTVSVQ